MLNKHNIHVFLLRILQNLHGVQVLFFHFFHDKAGQNPYKAKLPFHPRFGGGTWLVLSEPVNQSDCHHSPCKNFVRNERACVKCEVMNRSRWKNSRDKEVFKDSWYSHQERSLFFRFFSIFLPSMQFFSSLWILQTFLGHDTSGYHRISNITTTALTRAMLLWLAWRHKTKL